ncbi:hypothetical protein LAD74_00280 [Mycoplasma sp. U97]|uniref:hypothetical protein n=1 Tax=Mycoplasma tauri TaxID=547987 RepID=UPI001CC0F7FC|nr:hypothetical protein [Mycoplasma tauri]MBZ4212435.1 hypothetical protein [Mycoplasma tauri]
MINNVKINDLHTKITDIQKLINKISLENDVENLYKIFENEIPQDITPSFADFLEIKNILEYDKLQKDCTVNYRLNELREQNKLETKFVSYNQTTQYNFLDHTEVIVHNIEAIPKNELKNLVDQYYNNILKNKLLAKLDSFIHEYKCEIDPDKCSTWDPKKSRELVKDEEYVLYLLGNDWK